MKRKRRQRGMPDNAEKGPTRSVPKRKPVTVKLDRDLIERVMARVEPRGLSKVQMVRFLCEEFLTRPEDEGLAKIIDAIEKYERAQALLRTEKRTKPKRKI
jgi:hypothetical protein